MENAASLVRKEIFDNLAGSGLEPDEAAIKALREIFAHLGPDRTFALVVLGMLEQDDLAKILGYEEQTLRNWVAKRQLPFVRLGNRNVFLVTSLRGWLLKKEIKPHGGN